mmetsp:Transcript_19461/g.35779  ORF Transcript_19461/g.35779 Transcript_19461/m.35779 type:complete len:107 (-) Transcript_19461:1-321(-)
MRVSSIRHGELPDDGDAHQSPHFGSAGAGAGGVLCAPKGDADGLASSCPFSCPAASAWAAASCRSIIHIAAAAVAAATPERLKQAVAKRSLIEVRAAWGAVERVVP